MYCPHCNKWVSASLDNKAWRLAELLDPSNPTCHPMNKNDICVSLGIYLNEFEAIKRHYRDHLVAQTGLTLHYDRRLDKYWRDVVWIDLDNPDIQTWENEGLKRLYTESSHYRDGLAVAYKNIPATQRKKRLQVKDLHSTIAHVVERIDIALESAALQ